MNLPKIAIGTCAWSFEDWRGNFYPEDLPPSQWLHWYSTYLNAVEVDSTFYHLPSSTVAANWVASTPEQFTFTVKLPRAITHERKLRDCEDPLWEFLRNIESLTPKLGCIVVQLPPALKPGHDEDVLRRFVSILPRDWPFAIEFRDSAWHTPAVVHHLQERGVCWVWADTEPLSHQSEGAFEWLPQTADFLYIRLLGDLSTKYRADGSRLHRYGRLMWPRDLAIENWTTKIRHHLGEVRRIFVFAGNHFEGSSPITCERVGRALGLPVTLPKPPTDPQMDLF